MTIFVKKLETPLGEMEAGIESESNSLVFFDFINRKSFRELKEKRIQKWGDLSHSSHPLHADVENQINEYFEGIRTEFDIPISLSGTDFEIKVWNALLGINYGKTLSYGELAKNMGRSPYLSRAVGRANSQNCIAIIVPCHRVIGSNGKLVGYGGGIDRKKDLLELESNLSVQTSLDEYL